MTTELLTVHEIALFEELELTNEQARLISNALSMISESLDLPTGTKKHRTSHDNPSYNGTTNCKKRITQSYNIRSFDPSLIYHFTQLAIILGLCS